MIQQDRQLRAVVVHKRLDSRWSLSPQKRGRE
jgi:hypothetical protein